MQHLDQLEARTIYILREAFARVDPLAMLWSIGKDSNALLWMARKAFFGRVPFPLIQLDTGMELPEVYAFRDRIAAEWELNLIVHDCPPESEMDPTLPPATRAAARKTEGLKQVLQQGYRGILAGIRRDEQATRAKERVFSPRTLDGAWDFRDQPPEFWDQYKTEFPEGTHVRIHPLLHWTEIDIWRYTQREGIPVVPLYFAREGKRYRSLGEKNITFPVASTASTIEEIIAELETTKVSERAGRAMDHEAEDSFERLRSSGYM
ncbi:sulfate adenylyltransferase subunit CysD [Arenibaculum pallidiluteum]|uniref:sulfate adenylyltransferase subunit CysD n=1 Tax=Arenibaculum pallidiluteum TaxID=2812559 RepID=UPI001A961D4A|nr:sulfate adenylyltransferase subunit CysD [Arenibaculum pallidiluteum]